MSRAQVAVPGMKVLAEDDRVEIVRDTPREKVTLSFTADGVTAQYGSEKPVTLHVRQK